MEESRFRITALARELQEEAHRHQEVIRTGFQTENLGVEEEQRSEVAHRRAHRTSSVGSLEAFLKPPGSLDVAELHQSFFLHAIFDLMQAKQEWETQVLENLRMKYPELPAANEAIMFGHLRKFKGQSQNRVKFVVVSPGFMTLVNNENPVMLFGKHHKDKKEIVKQIKLFPGTRCKVIDKSGRFCFEIIDAQNPIECASPTWPHVHEPKPTEHRQWIATSQAERKRWMRVIEDAADIVTSVDHPVDHERLSELCLKLKSSSSSKDYLENLGALFGLKTIEMQEIEKDTEAEDDGDKSVVEMKEDDVPCCLEIPLDWAQKQLNLPRGGSQDDSSIDQILKDMQRDRMVINGVHFDGSLDCFPQSGIAGPAICSIIFMLAQKIQESSKDLQLSEAEALELAHQVLLSSNRTQSGGNTLDCTNLMCAHDHFGFVAADSNVMHPLKINVYTQNSQASYRASPELPAMSAVSVSSKPFLSMSKSLARSRRRRSVNQSDGLPMSPTSPQHCHSPPPIHRKSSSDGLFVDEGGKSKHPPNHQELLKSIRRIGHRRRKSDPLVLTTAVPSETPEDENEGDGEGKAQPRVDIEVKMQYKICNPSFEDESDAVLCSVEALYRRTFAILGQRKATAIGQGSVKLSFVR